MINSKLVSPLELEKIVLMLFIVLQNVFSDLVTTFSNFQATFLLISLNVEY